MTSRRLSIQDFFARTIDRGDRGMNSSRLIATIALLSIPAVAFPYSAPNKGADSGFVFDAVRRSPIQNAIEATGTVEAVAQVDVGSAVSGLLDKVFVNFNDDVVAGQPLAQLDRGAFEARVNAGRAALKVATALVEVQRSALRRAELGVTAADAEKKSAEAQAKAAQARRGEAERELQRKLQLSRSGAATDREVDQTRTARDTAEAELRVALGQIETKADAIEIAKAEAQMALANVTNAEAVVEEKRAVLEEAEVELERTVIRAPIDGIVISREVNPGQAVAAGLETKTLFRIAHDLSEMQVKGSIDEADIGSVKEGESAEFTVDAYPNHVFCGRVVQVRKAPETVQNVVTYSAIVSAPNPGKLLYPGMTAALNIVTQKTGDVLSVPNSALHFKPASLAGPMASGPNQGIVWTSGAEGQVRPVAIETGAADDNRTEVVAGPLREGDALIVGIKKVQSGVLSALRGSNE
jgi:HlyD family secretion protein